MAAARFSTHLKAIAHSDPRRPLVDQIAAAPRSIRTPAPWVKDWSAKRTRPRSPSLGASDLEQRGIPDPVSRFAGKGDPAAEAAAARSRAIATSKISLASMTSSTSRSSAFAGEALAVDRLRIAPQLASRAAPPRS
jgi:hypothetical protein